MTDPSSVARVVRATSRRGLLTAVAALSVGRAAFGLSLDPLEGAARTDYLGYRGRCQAIDAQPNAPPNALGDVAAAIRAVGRCPLCGCAVNAADAAEHLSGDRRALTR